MPRTKEEQEYIDSNARAARSYGRKLMKSSQDESYVICSGGFHWVKPYTKKNGESVEGHCARDPSRTRTLYTEGEDGTRFKWEVPKDKTFTDMRMR